MKPERTDTKPWYRYPLVWMVISGPLIVVIAAIGTAIVAIRGQDPVLTREDSAAAAVGREGTDASSPAMQARNHAATPKAADSAHKPAGD